MSPWRPAWPIGVDGAAVGPQGGTASLRETAVVAAPGGFTYEVRSSGEVVIRHHGRIATTLRGRRADAFLDDAAHGDEQELMARLTGNYRRGNERLARDHPRHRGGRSQ
jgi:hypothetical protein